jgi:hypothetical protein
VLEKCKTEERTAFGKRNNFFQFVNQKMLRATDVKHDSKNMFFSSYCINSKILLGIQYCHLEKWL